MMYGMREFYTWKMSENSYSLPRVLLLSGSNEPVRVVIELSSRNGYNDKWREFIKNVSGNETKK